MVRHDGKWGSGRCILYFCDLFVITNSIYYVRYVILMFNYTPEKVCYNNFDSIDADSACYTLGYTRASQSGKIEPSKWSKPEIPFWIDQVNCASDSTNFLTCTKNDWGVENCDHSKNVFLSCFKSD